MYTLDKSVCLFYSYCVEQTWTLCNELKIYEQVISDLISFQTVLYHIKISNAGMQLFSEFVKYTEQGKTKNE